MDEEWGHFFISSFFMPTLDIASSFFIASFDIVSLAIPSLPILSCANAAGADAAPSEMMTAEARSKTREALFMVLPFKKLVSTTLVVKLNTLWTSTMLRSLYKLPFGKWL